MTFFSQNILRQYTAEQLKIKGLAQVVLGFELTTWPVLHSKIKIKKHY